MCEKMSSNDRIFDKKKEQEKWLDIEFFGIYGKRNQKFCKTVERLNQL